MSMLELRATGDRRRLPYRILGFNSPVPYSLPWEDPAIVPLVRELAPALLRFPGGTVANFWDWREGQLRVPETEGASQYRTFLVRAAQMSRTMHPAGCSIEQFARFAAETGAELVVCANLESATPDDQAAWFAHMREAGVAPTLVEMGNEFSIALLGDAESMRRFPDWDRTVKLTREYLDAIGPYLPDGARIALQSAASRFYHADEPAAPLGRRMWTWDDDAERSGRDDWFHAVTAHLYPAVQGVFGPGGAPSDADDVCRGVVARAHAGTARLLEHLEATMPGKQVWVTEWGVEAAGQVIRGERTGFTGLWLHVLARMLLAMLRHPSVTIAQYHALFFDGGVYSLFRRDRESGGYRQIGPAGLFRWFNEAANLGATYERMHVPGARMVAGGGLVDESYPEIEAAAFERDGRRVVFVHNASPDAHTLSLGGAPARVEALVARPGDDLSRGTPEPVDLPASEVLDVPGWSVVRAEW